MSMVEHRQKGWWATVSKNLSDMIFQTQEIPATLAHPLCVQCEESQRKGQFSGFPLIGYF